MANVLLLWRYSLVLGLFLFGGLCTAAEFFAPSSGKGLAVVLLSGASGPHLYRWYALDVAKLGYTAVLLPGWEVSLRESDSAANLVKAIEQAQADDRVVPGKVAVIGFSLGGGGALMHATPLKDRVAGVIAYYPNLTRAGFDAREAGTSVAVPTLILAGENDTYRNCCRIESIRGFVEGAQTTGVSIELVAYPEAGHSFIQAGINARPEAAADAWERTRAFLAKHLPLR